MSDPHADPRIRERCLAAMSDLIVRVVRAERMSGVKEHGSLKSIRNEYLNISAPGAKRHTEAHEIFSRFVRSAQAYYERASSNVTYIHQWTRYENQRLRKSIARLVQLQAESTRAEALRRLRSPIFHFIKFPNGEKVTLTDMKHTPLYDTFVAPPKPAPVAHDVLVAAGLIPR